MPLSTPHPSRQPTNPLRNDWDGELWNDISAVIWSSDNEDLVVKLPMDCRVHVETQALILAAGDLVITIDSIPNPFQPSIAGAGWIAAFWDIDLTPGSHTIVITSSGGLDTYFIHARRGRKPTP